MLDFRKKLEIGVSDKLSKWAVLSVGFLKVKPKANKKSEKLGQYHCLFICFQMDTQYKNLKYPI